MGVGDGVFPSPLLEGTEGTGSTIGRSVPGRPEELGAGGSISVMTELAAVLRV